MMNNVKPLVYFVVIFMCLIGGGGGIISRPSSASAETKGIDFDENYRYDLYFDYAMVKGIKILGLYG